MRKNKGRKRDRGNLGKDMESGSETVKERERERLTKAEVEVEMGRRVAVVTL